MSDKINKININGTSYDIQDNVSGYITGINAADVSSALGYTPYNATNPNGYVNAAGAANAAPVQSVNGSTGTVVLTAADVGALPSGTSIPSKISDLTNDQVYDLGVLNLVQLTSFVLTQEQHTTIAQMWNRGLCAVTFRLTNDSSTQYLAFKQFMGSLYDSDDNIYVFSGATVGYHFIYNPSTGDNDIEYTSGTIALGVMADAPYGAIAYMPDVTEDNVRTISHSEIIDTAVLQVNNKSPDNYGEITLKTSDLQNDSGYITGISSTDVTTALGYTPYDSTNPSGYVTASGAASAAPVQSVNNQTGVVTLSASDVGALPSNTFIPTKTSDLTNDSGFITTETDPTVPSWAKASTKPSYTAAEVGALPDTTTIPSKTSDLTNDSGFITTETDPTVPSWAKASTKPSYTASEVGALPDTTVIPSKTSDLTNDSGFITGMTILSYGSSTWQDFLSAYNSNQVIYCRASSNSNPASGSQTRLAFMAYVSNATSPTNVEFQYYRSMSSHSATAQGDEVYVYKLTSAGTWTVTVRKASPNIVAGTGLSRSYSNDTVTLSLDGTIPTKTSDLTNDSGYLTLSTLPIWDGSVT